MWSVGGAVLLEVVLCIAVVALAARRLHGEIEPARRSFELLHREMAGAARTVTRRGSGGGGPAAPGPLRKPASVPVASAPALPKGSR